MSRKSLRTENLIVLFERYGGATEIARECLRNGEKVDPVTIGQIKNRTPLPSGNPRGIGDKLAEKLEKGLNLGDRWMDTDHCAGTSTHNEIDEVMQATHKNGNPVRIRKIPVVSTTTGGNWDEVVDNFHPGDAERWIDAPDTVSDKSFALVIIGASMSPTIPDGSTIIVDPTAEYNHKSVVVVRQNGDTEATCKRLVYEGSTPYLKPDNEQYGVPRLLDDAVVVGVVKQVVIDL